MRPIRKMAGIALLAVVIVGCDTNEPLQVEQQTFSLSLRGGAGNAVARLIFVYDGFEDNNGDSTADDVNGDGQPDYFLWCIDSGQTINADSAPLRFTIEVSVLRAGQTTRELLTSTAARSDPMLNLSDYDESAPAFGNVPVQNPITIDDNGMMRTFRFTNGRRLSGLHRSIVAATKTQPTAWGMGNPLTTLDNTPYVFGNGLCSTNDPGPAVVDSGTADTYPYPIVLDQGDTVTVKARRGTGTPSGITVLNASTLALAASLTLDGRPVTVRGTTTSAGGPGEGFIFSFTAR